MKKLEHSCTVCKWHSHYGRLYGSSSEKLILGLPCNSAVLLLSAYLKKVKARTQTCTGGGKSRFIIASLQNIEFILALLLIIVLFPMWTTISLLLWHPGFVHSCSWQHYSQWPKGGSNPEMPIYWWTIKQNTTYAHSGILFSLKNLERKCWYMLYNMDEPWRPWL